MRYNMIVGDSWFKYNYIWSAIITLISQVHSQHFRRRGVLYYIEVELGGQLYFFLLVLKVSYLEFLYFLYTFLWKNDFSQILGSDVGLYVIL